MKSTQGELPLQANAGLGHKGLLNLGWCYLGDPEDGCQVDGMPRMEVRQQGWVRVRAGGRPWPTLVLQAFNTHQPSFHVSEGGGGGRGHLHHRTQFTGRVSDPSAVGLAGGISGCCILGISGKKLM